MAEARLGPDRLAGAYAWNSILKAGGRLAFGSDVPVESPDPFAGLAAGEPRPMCDSDPDSDSGEENPTLDEENDPPF